MRLATAIALCAVLFPVGDGVNFSSTASIGTRHTRLDTIRPDQIGPDRIGLDRIGLDWIGLGMDFI